MKKIIFFSGAILGFCVRSFSQIQGDVTDPKDKGIPNAIIIATDSVKKSVDTVKSDSRGFYSFDHLKPGNYKIEIKAAGFQPVIIKNIVVKEGEIGLVEDDLYNGQRLNITLNPAKVPK
ncbi:MAG TPA: carboxypeptidase-like regulatory domain-containing protein [Chitinophagaceae bacterium]|nr:carboxypeptidase-like regulatory domain-containing protein [Chitinophagaceae bacterium]